MSNEIISAPEAAKRMGISSARLRRLLLDGRIPGATRSNPGNRYRGEWSVPTVIGEAPKRSAPHG